MPRWSVVRAVSRFGSIRLLTRTWKYCCIIGGDVFETGPNEQQADFECGIAAGLR